ncbi:IS630 family transposase [Candidatus Tisiphia endosymbiont of Mystacides longicornis]|uniref:IS630 family transposase n=1 Tax=Candidatus Tisiphia endosymbiont of Mystacides longicornis TaxID=3139330 RepID=UPI003CCB34A1
MNSLKKIQEKITSNPRSFLYFFDESRFGTHSKLGHGWFRKGSRTQVKIKIGFQNFYVYSAVNPITGDDFSLMMPNVNTMSLNMFFAKMSKHIGDQKAIVVMDCAGWHKYKDLVVPANIEILYLPPYSPELNPAERLCEHLKSETIKNKVYNTIEQLEIAVSSSIKNLNTSLIQSICCMNYLLN